MLVTAKCVAASCLRNTELDFSQIASNTKILNVTFPFYHFPNSSRKKHIDLPGQLFELKNKKYHQRNWNQFNVLKIFGSKVRNKPNSHTLFIGVWKYWNNNNWNIILLWVVILETKTLKWFWNLTQTMSSKKENNK